MADIQVIYAPGTFGTTVRWMFDRFTKGSKLKSFDSPWDKDGRAHGFDDSDYNIKFKKGHQLDGRIDSPDLGVPHRYPREDDLPLPPVGGADRASGMAHLCRGQRL